MLALLGYLLVAVGICTADSDCLIAPTILAVSGAILLVMYSKKEGNNE